jgi:hypothetical protein
VAKKKIKCSVRIHKKGKKKKKTRIRFHGRWATDRKPGEELDPGLVSFDEVGGHLGLEQSVPE